MDRERLSFDSRVRGMVGVLAVRDEHPGPGHVTLRVVAGHGNRIRGAAAAIAPPGLVLHVLEDDLVTTVPELPPPDLAGRTRIDGAGRSGTQDRPAGSSGDAATLCCDYVFCRHRATAAEFGVVAGDRCRQKIRVEDGWMSCPGSYRPLPPARRRWWRPLRR